MIINDEMKKHMDHLYQLEVYVWGAAEGALIDKGMPADVGGVSVECTRCGTTVVTLYNTLIPDEECPNCHFGTLEKQGDDLVCRGECGQIFKSKNP